MMKDKEAIRLAEVQENNNKGNVIATLKD